MAGRVTEGQGSGRAADGADAAATPELRPAEARLVELARAYRKPSKRPLFWGSFWLLLLALMLGALVARSGTDGWRALGAALAFGTPVMVLVLAVLRERKWKGARGALGAVRTVDAKLAERLGRAVRLAGSRSGAADSEAVTDSGASRGNKQERGESSGSNKQERGELSGRNKQERGESSELVWLHLEQTLGQVPVEKVILSGRRSGRRVFWLAVLVMLTVLGVFFTRVFAVTEGFDVMLARNGVGPWPVAYLEAHSVRARVPAYLPGGAKYRSVSGDTARLPAGSELEYRILPRVEGRRFVLTDGVERVPFVSDGQGALVARLVAEDPNKLRVAAVFGDVLLLNNLELDVTTERDLPPLVSLVDAPRQVELADLDRLELSFSAVDDHGLAAVDLVLKSGSREERSTLVHLGGRQQSYRGGYTLRRRHPMLRGAYLPVTVGIEARDADSVGGPNWGKSPVITLMPAALGQPLAVRHRALRAFREALTVFLAEDLAAAEAGASSGPLRRRKAGDALATAVEELAQQLEATGEVPKGSLAFVRAQVQTLTEPGEPDRVRAVLLAVDVLMGDLATHDAKQLAKDLADSVEEIAVRAQRSGERDQTPSRETLLALALAADRGAEQLREVGELGLDLGSVATADLARVRRGIDAGDFQRVSAAALHLAARLRRGTPSFGAQSSGGVEAGHGQGGKGGGRGQGAPSRAPTDYDDLVEQVDSLAKQHDEELNRLERLLDAARRAAAQDTAEDGKTSQVAAELREAMARLPVVGTGPGSASSEAAQGRSQGEAMADALEHGATRDAAERGEAAKQALERAQQRLRERGGRVSERDLVEALRAVERATAAARKAAAALANEPGDQQLKQEFEESAAREREMGRLARELAERGAQGEARLPQKSRTQLDEAGRLMEKAADALEQRDGDRAADLAERAQEMLDAANPGSARDGGGEHPAESTSDRFAKEAEIPKDEEDRAREFRERVERGLSQEAGRLSPAAARYAEELK